MGGPAASILILELVDERIDRRNVWEPKTSLLLGTEHWIGHPSVSHAKAFYPRCRGPGRPIEASAVMGARGC